MELLLYKGSMRMTDIAAKLGICGVREQQLLIDCEGNELFSINGIELCSRTLPADFGKNPGIYTPSWWDRNGRQHIKAALTSGFDMSVILNPFSFHPPRRRYLRPGNRL